MSDGSPADDGSLTQGPDEAGSSRHLTLILSVAGLVVAVDQLTKWWALNALESRTIHVIWTLDLRLVFNTGAAFSLADGFGPLVAFLALIVVGVLLWTGRAVSNRLGALAVGLVLGGAIGNLLDRFFRAGDGFFGGAVVDFIDLRWWPVFNVADMCVVIGAVMLVAVGSRAESS